MGAKKKLSEEEQSTQQIAEEMVAEIMAAHAAGTVAPAGFSQEEAEAQAEADRCPFCSSRSFTKARVEGVKLCRHCGSYYGAFEHKSSGKKAHFRTAFSLIFHGVFGK